VGFPPGRSWKNAPPGSPILIDLTAEFLILMQRFSKTQAVEAALRIKIRFLLGGLATAALIATLLFIPPPLAQAQLTPQIVSTSPAQNELHVPISSNISVTFDTDMDETTINGSSFIVNARSTGLHQGTITYNNATKTATLDPDNHFQVGDVVTVVMTTDVFSSQGIPLGKSYVWSFTIAVDPGEGTFAPQLVYPVGNVAWSIFAADLDGDGDIDLATVNDDYVGNCDYSILLNNGDGTFAAPSVYPLVDCARWVYGADLDGDDDIDLATANLNNTNVPVYLNNGDGTFAQRSIYPVHERSSTILAADLDGDGYLDLTIISFGVSVLLNNGDGTFAPYQDYPGDGSSIAAADVDGDGDLDLISGYASVLLNNGDGTFVYNSDYPYGGNSIYAADLDGDGAPDLAFSAGDCVGIVLNNGDGTFGDYTAYPTGWCPQAIFGGDLDGDGDIDIATANGLTSDVSVLINNGDGTFSPESRYQAETSERITIADLNGDGHLDLIVVNPGMATISVLLNEGPNFCTGFNGLFCDDFEDGVMTEWQTLRDDLEICAWSEADGILSSYITGQKWHWCIQTVGDQSWENYIFEADVKGNTGVDKVLVFRVQDAENFYAVNLRSDYPSPIDEVTFDKMAGNTYTADIVTAAYPSENGQWYRLKITCVENSFKVYVEDALVLEYTDNHNPYYSGGIGLARWTGIEGDCDIAFDNVTVTEPTVPHIHLNPSSLQFEAVQGGPPPVEQTFTITNVGGDILDWEVTDDQDWIDVSPVFGVGNSQEITVSINTAALTPGTHNATITVSSANADNSPQTADVVYSIGEPSLVSVGLITIRADNLSTLNFGADRGKSGHLSEIVFAEGNVRIGDVSGENYYLDLGPNSSVQIDLANAEIVTIAYDAVSMLSQSVKYIVDDIVDLTITANDGTARIEGTLHTHETAVYADEISVIVTLGFNTAQFEGEIKLGDEWFTNLGFNFGVWDLDGCPVLGIQGTISISTPIEFPNNYTLGGEITVALFLNTGILRVGLGAGILSDESGTYGIDFKYGGTLDFNRNNLEISVVDDISLFSTPILAADMENEDPQVLRDAAGSVVGLGLTIWGEEPFEDLNCNGAYDYGEPFEDVKIPDQEWTQGSMMRLWPDIYFYGHGSLDVGLLEFVHLTIVDMIVEYDWPEKIDFAVSAGGSINNLALEDPKVLDLEVGSITLTYYCTDVRFHGTANLLHSKYSPVHLSTEFDIDLNYGDAQFSGLADLDFTIGEVNFAGSQVDLSLDVDALKASAQMFMLDKLDAEATLELDWFKKISGTFSGEVVLDGLKGKLIDGTYKITGLGCTTVTGTLSLCIFLGCMGPHISVQLCCSECITCFCTHVDGIYFGKDSPVELHVYDDLGRHVGKDDFGGLDLEIPGALFFEPNADQEMIYIPDPQYDGNYRVDLRGVDGGMYNFVIVYQDPAKQQVYEVGFYEEPTQQYALHRLYLSHDGDLIMYTSMDGDTLFENETEADSVTVIGFDETIPIVTSVVITSTFNDSAIVAWSTNIPTIGHLQYGLDSVGQFTTSVDSALEMIHYVTLLGLETKREYELMVIAEDSTGVIARSPVYSFLSLDCGTWGDVNNDGNINPVDVVFMINYVYLTNDMRVQPPNCPNEAGDVNCDGGVNPVDVVFYVNYVYLSNDMFCADPCEE